MRLDVPRIQPLEEGQSSDEAAELMKPFLAQGRVFNIFKTLIFAYDFVEEALLCQANVLSKLKAGESQHFHRGKCCARKTILCSVCEKACLSDEDILVSDLCFSTFENNNMSFPSKTQTQLQTFENCVAVL